MFRTVVTFFYIKINRTMISRFTGNSFMGGAVGNIL